MIVNVLNEEAWKRVWSWHCGPAVGSPELQAYTFYIERWKQKEKCWILVLGIQASWEPAPLV